MIAIDWALRGGAGAMLIFHIAHLLTCPLPGAHRWSLAAFVTSVLAYLACSHPDFREAPLALKAIAIPLCLMVAPLLWLSTQVIFRDGAHWRGAHSLSFATALGFGVCAALGLGGQAVVIIHKLVLIAFASAALWSVAQDWRSDLVRSRRTARTWFVALLGGHVAVVLVVELIFVNSRAPRELEMLNVAAIAALATLLAVVIARHPIHAWLCPTPVQVKATERIALTPLPPTVDRKAELHERLMRAMRDERAYAQEGLSLSQLAERLKTPATSLREAINQDLGYRNFNDFLHHYRLDEAAQRLMCQDLPILTIALDVGYASIGPFNRAFKQLKGMTPSEFRAQMPKS